MCVGLTLLGGDDALVGVDCALMGEEGAASDAAEAGDAGCEFSAAELGSAAAEGEESRFSTSKSDLSLSTSSTE